ncbi:PilZ domain-containing protein [Pseudomonas akapageensis]|uniref:PilZ domain-containing protein n=1 Tax=Pseudomonas akapageensis TaxID=2609961 RepID=UPI00140E1892|nr:PilZ domain-containing protein [Pseudomonas akapageensis]
MSTLDEEDRREYYRIEDRIALEISPLAGAEANDSDLLQDASPLFNLLSELHLSEFESQHLLRQLSDSDRTLANFLRAQNKRIDLLSQVVAQTILGKIGEPQPVVLSENGVEFSQAQAIKAGTLLSVKMALMPQALGLLLRARVIHCDPRPDGRFEIGTEFEALSDAQRQLLARYILQKQAQQRRSAREKSESPST